MVTLLPFRKLCVLPSKIVVQNYIFMYLHVSKMFNKGLISLVFFSPPFTLYRVKDTNGMQKLKDGFLVLFFMATSSHRFLEDMLPAK